PWQDEMDAHRVRVRDGLELAARRPRRARCRRRAERAIRRRQRRRCRHLFGIRPVVVALAAALAAARREPADVGPVAVALLQRLLGRVWLVVVVVVLVLFGNAEVDERAVPEVAETQVMSSCSGAG